MQVYGEDLARMEDKRSKLEQQRAELEGKKFIVPGKKKALLAELDSQIAGLGQDILNAREHVFSNPTSVKMYHAEQARIAEKNRETELEKTGKSRSSQSKEISDYLVSQAEKRENGRLAKEANSSQEKTKEAMAYLAESMKDRAKNPSGSQYDPNTLSTKRKRDLEWEPGDD